MKPLGMVVLRLTLGLTMALGHGVPKLTQFSELSLKFPDPLGVGHSLSLSLAIGAELGCSILLVLGLFTRAATLPLIFTMLVAVFVIHGEDPFSKKELGLLYLYGYTALLFLGGGILEVQAFVRPYLQGLQNRLLRFVLEA